LGGKRKALGKKKGKEKKKEEEEKRYINPSKISQKARDQEEEGEEKRGEKGKMWWLPTSFNSLVSIQLRPTGSKGVHVEEKKRGRKKKKKRLRRWPAPV